MKALLHSLLEAATLGRPVVLCTVVHSGGSAPRSAGAHMAVFADGSTRGTVGGGRLELLTAKEGLSLLQRQTSALRAYDLSEREGGIGMACGGNVIVSYLYLGPEQADFVRAMAAAFDAAAPCWLKLVIAGDGTQPGRVYLFGAGHVGQALVPVLEYVGFAVTVYDPRQELAERFSDVICAPYAELEDHITLTPYDSVVVMTPGHMADFEVLHRILRHPLSYIGCIGSRNKAAKTRDLLRQEGFSEETIASVHLPIGLPILAQTPAEIAISIAGEMIRCRAEAAQKR